MSVGGTIGLKFPTGEPVWFGEVISIVYEFNYNTVIPTPILFLVDIPIQTLW